MVWIKLDFTIKCERDFQDAAAPELCYFQFCNKSKQGGCRFELPSVVMGMREGTGSSSRSLSSLCYYYVESEHLNLSIYDDRLTWGLCLAAVGMK